VLTLTDLLLVPLQLKGMLDLVEQDLLTPLGVSYLRLDGSVDANQRFAIVQVSSMSACDVTFPDIIGVEGRVGRTFGIEVIMLVM
jgi:hypothetical protein